MGVAVERVMQNPVTDSTLKLRALLKSAGASFSIAHHRAGDTIYLQGDVSNTVMHIEEGRVRLSVSEPSGKEAVFGLIGPGAFLGEEVLGGCGSRQQTAIAIGCVELLAVSKMEMAKLISQHPAISERFIAHILGLKSKLETDLTVQLLYSSEQRLALTLLSLAGCDSRSIGRHALPKMSQELIAEMVGTTRSRVNLFMGKFKKLGFLEQHDGHLQVNPSNLAFVRAADRDSFRGDA